MITARDLRLIPDLRNKLCRLQNAHADVQAILQGKDAAEKACAELSGSLATCQREAADAKLRCERAEAAAAAAAAREVELKDVVAQASTRLEVCNDERRVRWLRVGLEWGVSGCCCCRGQVLERQCAEYQAEAATLRAQASHHTAQQLQAQLQLQELQAAMRAAETDKIREADKAAAAVAAADAARTKLNAQKEQVRL